MLARVECVLSVLFFPSGRLHGAEIIERRAVGSSRKWAETGAVTEKKKRQQFVCVFLHCKPLCEFCTRKLQQWYATSKCVLWVLLAWQCYFMHFQRNFRVYRGPDRSEIWLSRQWNVCCAALQHYHNCCHAWSMKCRILHAQHADLYASQHFVFITWISDGRINYLHCLTFIPKIPCLQSVGNWIRWVKK